MKIALGIEYNGSGFSGWQAQTNLVTVQGTVENALTRIAAEPIQVVCAGRTDAGVHSTGQVVHFTTSAQRELRAWTYGTNAYLTPSISVCWAQVVDDTFHARFSAIARRYRYIILNRSLRSALLAARATWYYYPLNVELMQTAANFLLGEHDFSSFRSSRCESKTAMRNIQEITLSRQGDFVIMDIQANAFLHHMVRNIAGVLMQIGAGFKNPEWIKEVLSLKNRQAAADTAHPHGLYLTQVFYPDPYLFPTNHHSFLF